MSTQREQRLVFDEAASLYDQYRAEYPARVAEDLLEVANVTEGDRILEIGCGTGKATQRFAPYGFWLLALELGQAMAEIARHKLAAHPHVTIDTITFEEWPLEAESFQLIYAAMSLHWVDPDLAFTKTADALVPGGTLAVISNRPQRGDSALDQAIQQAYEQVKDVKPLKAHPKAVQGSPAGTVERFQASGRFGTVFTARYPHSATYRADEYIKLMLTMSDHRMMPDEPRRWLLDEIHAAIERFGGFMTVNYMVTLKFARRLTLYDHT